jgi:magnesium transporter
MDMHLSLVNNRMGQVIKTLTIITTLVLPLSLLTSFFGMNFFPAGRGFESWTGHPLFTAVLAAIVVIPLLMLWIMKRNRWL